MNLFSHDSFLSRFLHLMGDIITLHLLWILLSLPVITIGASTTALYYSCMKRIRTNEGYVTSNFMSAFRSNFRQASIVWIGMVLVGLILFTNFRIGLFMGNLPGNCIIISSSILLFPYLMTSLYIFPVLARFSNPIYENLKNAFFMAIRHFPLTLLLLLIIATFVILIISFPPFTGLAICCGFGLFGYLTAGIFVFIFRNYTPEEPYTSAS